MKLIRLADYARQNRLRYNVALDHVLRGVVPARRVGARWWVEVPLTKRIASRGGSKRAALSAPGRIMP